jgi:hypothetical protein
MKTRMVLVAGAVAAIAAAGPASALVAPPSLSLSTTQTAAGGNSSDAGIHDTRGQQTRECVDSMGQHQGTFTYDGPEYVWPPNHKYRNADISLTDDDGDMDNASTVAVVGTNDETAEDGTEMNGAGDTDPATDSPPSMGSGDPTATAHQQFRGERSGRGDGRVYTFTVTGTTDGGKSMCKAVTFTSTVPHDQSGHTNSGPKKSVAAKKRAAKLRAAKLRRARR